MLVVALSVSACKDAPPVAKAPTDAPTPRASATMRDETATAPTPPPPASAPPTTSAPPSTTTTAEIGKPAPEIELLDLDGKTVKLSGFRGKVVVLEWFNAGCPFVMRAHTKGSLKTAAKDAKAKGVVWLAISSSADGKQGAGVQANRDGATKFGLSHPILLDASGAVGHMYGATNTPHVFVVDEAGTLVYRGAVDNSPDGEGESPTGGKLVSYVDATLADLAAKRPVAIPTTRAYGCGVKYASH